MTENQRKRYSSREAGMWSQGAGGETREIDRAAGCAVRKRLDLILKATEAVKQL